MPHRHHGFPFFHDLDHLCELGDFVPGRFARLFNDLPPLYINPLKLHDLGAVGGPLEDKGKPNLAKDTPLGLIFFGQFIDHDITLDVSSSLSSTNDASGTENVRTPTLDLDNVYGEGPEANPFLYEGHKLLTGADYFYAGCAQDELAKDDLPRAAPSGTAIIGDPRNDEHRVISQLQLGFLRFHNEVVDELEGRAEPPEDVFGTARRIARWHYQWIVIHDFLRTLCGDWIVDDILANGRKVYRPEDVCAAEPFIPIEFATGAYRFGHSMIAQEFRVQPKGKKHELFGKVLGNGFQPLDTADAIVEWAALLDDGSGGYERAGKLDELLAKDLLDLPFIPSPQAFERSLAVRNLLRAQSFLVPSGEQVARAMIESGAEEITEKMVDDVRDCAEKDLGLPKATPLWIYLLVEGRVIGRMDGDKTFSKGEGLGPAGARFVAEVLLGLLELDPRSFLGAHRGWSPEDSDDKLGGGDGVKTLYELLTFEAS